MKIMNNYCVGCYFAGTVDGYQPECNCCKKDAAIIASIENNEVSVDMLDYVDELSSGTKQYDTTHQNNKKARRMQRRIAAKKYAKTVHKNFAIATSKLKRLSANASSDDFDAAFKKLFNTDKKDVHSYQTSIDLAFPEIPEKSSFGPNMDTLYIAISKWKDAKDVSRDMKLACDNAIRILEAAFRYDGQLVGLHCERCERDDDSKKRHDDDVDVLHVKIGFSDKVSLLNFISKT